MSSSDSEDDCYGNVALKLQSLKSKLVTKADPIDVGSPSQILKTDNLKLDKTNIDDVVEDLNGTLNSTDNDELTLDAIIAQNTKRKSRGKRKSAEDSFDGTSDRQTRSAKRKTANSTRGRKKDGGQTPETAPTVLDAVPMVPPSEPPLASIFTRGRRGRGRGRGRGNPNNRRRSRPPQPSTSPFYPTYSVGNTDEYPDFSDNQQLFASTKPADDEVQIIDEDPLGDDNEELSVKVYWQSLEIFKFKIRKYQKITQIFDYFADRENVSYDKMLFTYNERILKIDDTPDAINYSIAKFIDGGIVNQDVTQLVKENRKTDELNGFKIKFQCQNKKKPFETSIQPEDKLALAMMKCAEHFETPLDRLKFYFDGDLISNKSTPKDLELEGGECIDVKIS